MKMNNQERQALIEWLESQRDACDEIHADNCTREQCVTNRIALATLTAEPVQVPDEMTMTDAVRRKLSVEWMEGYNTAIAHCKELNAAPVKLPDEIVGWVREEDGDSRDPLFLCGKIKPFPDGKAYNSKYFPVKRLNGIELAKQEPIYQFIMNRPDIDGYIEWVDCNKNYFDSCGDDIRRIIYAAPPAPFVVDSKSFERGLSILNETLDDCGDSERGLLLALTKMGVEVQGE